MMPLQRLQIGSDLRYIAAPFNALVEAVEKLYRMSGTNIAVTYPGGVPNFEYIGTRGSGSPSTSSSYSGPFAVVKKDDTTVTILGYHADEDRNWKNYVYAGLTATEVAEQDKASITTSGYLYLDVTYSSGYSVAVGFATSVPAQSATHYYHPLAWIECADSKISSVLQMQYGQIFIAGRVV